MALTQNDKDEIRYLITAEIRDAFQRVLKAVVEPPIIGFSSGPENQTKKQNYDKINEVARSVDAVLHDLESKARAKIMEKKDGKRARVIRELKPEL